MRNPQPQRNSYERRKAIKEKRRLGSTLRRLLLEEDLQGFHEALEILKSHCKEWDFSRPRLDFDICRPSDRRESLNLKGLKLEGIILSRMKFFGADLSGCVIKDCEIKGAVRFIGCNIQDSVFENLEDCDNISEHRLIFMSTRLVGSKFLNISLVQEKGRWGYDEPGGIGFRKNVNLRDCSFNNCVFNWLQMSDIFGLRSCVFNETYANSLSLWSAKWNRGDLSEIEAMLEDAKNSSLKNACSEKHWQANISSLEEFIEKHG